MQEQPVGKHMQKWNGAVSQAGLQIRVVIRSKEKLYLLIEACCWSWRPPMARRTVPGEKSLLILVILKEEREKRRRRETKCSIWRPEKD